jgi:hypothetical protein
MTDACVNTDMLQFSWLVLFCQLALVLKARRGMQRESQWRQRLLTVQSLQTACRESVFCAYKRSIKF